MPAESSAESPLPVRTVARMIGRYIARLGRVWVEGQVTEINRRPGSGTVFMVLRDPVADVSLRLTCSKLVCDAVVPPLQDGARVVINAKPDFHLGRGALSLTAFEIKGIGVGELLARLERLKQQLGAEGLFNADRKRPLPFLPTTVGLITGRASAAERDVVETARRRWPGVEFEIREVAVQGPQAVPQVTEALASLDRLTAVDVIIIARGGGSMEDLLPFSEESLIRAVATARTPIISAIGHEPDSPLLDFVADFRAATPTDAARRVVPDVTAELAMLSTLRGRARRSIGHRLDAEARHLASLRARPVLAAPGAALERGTSEVLAFRDRARRCAVAHLDRAAGDLGHAHARVRALSPAATLERGYAVVQLADGTVVRSAEQVSAEAKLRIRVADGDFTATATAAALSPKTQTI